MVELIAIGDVALTTSCSCINVLSTYPMRIVLWWKPFYFCKSHSTISSVGRIY